ncbi:hypothetical protein EJ04DRAFT_224513 [Polyplosphaeria fusca]|uniref:Uncharacterized protein n=1 Tax=Polyplosphaeria fusca TaxID=682080 RepID=A0A9P4V360_9PLEO|nr:hypothetical protein EJ04DRAFT_224513 [Polyplosphaeria fusca]
MLQRILKTLFNLYHEIEKTEWRDSSSTKQAKKKIARVTTALRRYVYNRRYGSYEEMAKQKIDDEIESDNEESEVSGPTDGFENDLNETDDPRQEFDWSDDDDDDEDALDPAWEMMAESEALAEYVSHPLTILIHAKQNQAA